MKISFTVPGQPIGKARTRNIALKRCRRCGAKTVRHECRCGSKDFEFLTTIEMTPKGTVVYENQVAAFAREAMSAANLEGLLSGGLKAVTRFYFAIPKSRQKKLKEGDPHTQKPDASNCLKSVEDGLNKVLYGDDSQIWQVTVSKHWSNMPRAEIEVESQ